MGWQLNTAANLNLCNLSSSLLLGGNIKHNTLWQMLDASTNSAVERIHCSLGSEVLKMYRVVGCGSKSGPGGGSRSERCSRGTRPRDSHLRVFPLAGKANFWNFFLPLGETTSSTPSSGSCRDESSTLILASWRSSWLDRPGRMIPRIWPSENGPTCVRELHFCA
jgi:hypothetical protein